MLCKHYMTNRQRVTKSIGKPDAAEKRRTAQVRPNRLAGP